MNNKSDEIVVGQTTTSPNKSRSGTLESNLSPLIQSLEETDKKRFCALIIVFSFMKLYIDL